MSQLVDSINESSYPGWRRHTDPPNLWLHVLTGSILLHALVILSLRQSVAPLSPPPSTQAVPVDLIDVNPTIATSSQSIRNPRTASKQGATGRSLHSSQNFGAVRSQTARNTVSLPSSLTPFTRSPQREISNSGERKFVQDGIGRSPQTTPFPQPTNTPYPSSGHSGTHTVRPSPGPTPSQSPRPTTPSTSSSPSNSPEGKGFAMTFTEFHVVTGGTNIPDPGRGAKPMTNSQPFPGIPYKAQTRKQFGKVVELELTIDEKGVLQNAKVQKRSGDADYDELVKEQILNWEFEPAYQAGKPVESFLDVSVKLDPIKQR